MLVFVVLFLKFIVEMSNIKEKKKRALGKSTLTPAPGLIGLTEQGMGMHVEQEK